MEKKHLKSKVLADNLRMIAEVIEHGYPLYDEEKQIIEELTTIILLREPNRKRESKIEKVDLIEQETRDIEKAIETVERLISQQNAETTMKENEERNSVNWKEVIEAKPNVGKKIDRLTNEEYDELAEKTDEQIRKNNIASSTDQKVLKLTRFK